MTVNVATSKVSYAGNGSTTLFAFAFPITVSTDLKVVLRNSSGVETTKVITTNYTVSAAPYTSGGTVTMLVAPATGETLLIKRNVAVTQLVDYRDGDSFPAETHEGALDKLTFIAQQLTEVLGRAVTLQEVTTLGSLVLPDPAAGTVLYSADGLSISWAMVATLGAGSVALPLSLPNGGTGGITAAAARINLGENASGSPFTRKHNFSAAVAPAVTDDSVGGYSVGSHWYDTTSKVVYQCIDATVSAAIWLAMLTETGPTFKNRIINGAMDIDQRKEGTLTSVASTSNTFTVDRWSAFGQVADGVFSVQKVSATPPVGFVNYLHCVTTTADAAIGAGQSYGLRYVIEGYDVAHLLMGTANAKASTLSFQVRASRAGTYSVALHNSAITRTFLASFTLLANTWTLVKVQVPGCTDGAWVTDNGVGLRLVWSLGTGATFKGSASAVWQAANLLEANGSVDIIAINADTFDLTGVQFELGNIATDFERLTVATQYVLCERYYEKSFDIGVVPAQNAGVFAGCAAFTQAVGAVTSSALGGVTHKQLKRSTPTVTTYNPVAANAQARNTSAGSDWSAMSVNAAGQSGFALIATSAAGSVAGGQALVHWTAEAEL